MEGLQEKGAGNWAKRLSLRKQGPPAASEKKSSPGEDSGVALDKRTKTHWPFSQAASFLLHNITSIYLD